MGKRELTAIESALAQRVTALTHRVAELEAALEKIAEVCNGYGDEAGWACSHARAALDKVRQT